MNEKMTFPELVDAVAAATETSKKVSESFLKELFSTIADTLRGGDNVKVKGLGVFKLIIVEARKSVNVNTGEEMEIPSHRKVSFIPDKALADAINMPFASFETVVLSDDLTDEDLKKMADVGELPSEEDGEPQGGPTPPPFTQKADDDSDKDEASQDAAGNAMAGSEVEEDAEDEVTEVKAPTEEAAEAEPRTETLANDSAKVEDEHKEADSDDEFIPEIEEIDDSAAIEEKTEAKEQRNIAHFDEDEDEEEEYLPQPAKDNNSFMRGFLWGAVTMFLIYMLVGGGIYLYRTTVANDEKEQAEEADSMDVMQDAVPLAIDSAAAADSAVSKLEPKPTAVEETSPKVKEPAKVDKPVVRYDTITRTKFLTRLAKKYYGNSDFWVYIYEENKAKIKNPNTISPGTVVVIPAADKYGIDKDNPESLKAARKKAGELERKYK